MEDMIHEALEGGKGITQAKEDDQKRIVALMSSKGSLRNVFLFHTYMVVARTGKGVIQVDIMGPPTTHIFQMAQNNFLAILAIYYF
jgi:hypothetical protein